MIESTRPAVPQAAPRSPADIAGHRAFWGTAESRSAPSLEDLLMPLPSACVDEFDRLLPIIDGARIADAVATASQALPSAWRDRLPRSEAFAREVRERLDRAPGAVVIDRFPAERYEASANRAMCGVFSSLMAPLLEQDHAGTLLYDVRDKRVADGTRVRRSITNLDQHFHTDGGWYAQPARYVGLYCLRNAARGGHSRVTSLLEGWRTLDAAGRRDVLDVLERAQPWDRQGEHAPDEPGWTQEPIVVRDDDGFLARFYESYVRDGYGKRGTAVPSGVSDALDAVSTLLDTQRQVRFLLQPGQYQYVNNHTLVHAREAFEDHDPEPGQALRGRHLIRVWHR